MIPLLLLPSLLFAAPKEGPLLIRFYQSVISPAQGPKSHFRPTSSAYMHEAIAIWGPLQGTLLGLDRLMRENDAPRIYRRTTLPDRAKFGQFDPIRP